MKKICSCMLAMAMAMAANASDYYLIGAFNGWSLKDPDVKFELQDDGNYALDYEGTLTSGFKINDGTWGEVNFGSNGTDLEVGVVYNLGSGGSSGNINMTSNVTNPHLEFNPEAATLLIAGQSVAPAAPVLYLRGDMNEWGASEKWQFSSSDDISYTLSNVSVTAGAKFKIGDATWGTNFGGAEDNVSVALNTPVVLTGDGKDLILAEGGDDLTFTFNLSTKTLTVTTEGETPDPTPGPTPDPTPGDYSAWWINCLGSFNDWKDNGVQVNEENIATWTGLAIGTGEFKVKVWNGESDVWYSNGEALPVSQWVKIEGNSVNNMTISDAAEDDQFTVKWNCATNEIYILKDGTVDVNSIEAIEDGAIYFNMQGIPVKNPIKGMYVKVVDGKSSKVVLK